MLKEYYEIDKETGSIVENWLLDEEKEKIPSNFVPGWPRGKGKQFWKPKWDADLGEWVEGENPAIIELKKKQVSKEESSLQTRVTNLEIQLQEVITQLQTLTK